MRTAFRKRHLLAAALSIAVFCNPLMAQKNAVRRAPVTLPADRVADSYRIYSALMPLGETAGTDWPHERWLVQDATVTVIPDEVPCKSDTIHMNPHIAVHPPEDRLQDFKEILQDFDNHCHDRFQLDPNEWKLPVPVVLLNSQEQKKFRTARIKGRPVNDRYKGAPALYGFSLVYFNAKHTVALVYATHYCGSLCGEGFWVALALENGEWKQLDWNSSFWIS